MRDTCLVCNRALNLATATWGRGEFCSRHCQIRGQEEQTRSALERETCKNCGEKTRWGMPKGYCSQRCQHEDVQIALADDAVIRSTFGIPEDVDLGLVEKDAGERGIKGVDSMLGWVDEVNDFDGENLWESEEYAKYKEYVNKPPLHPPSFKDTAERLGKAMRGIPPGSLNITMGMADRAFRESMLEAEKEATKLRKMMEG